MANHKSRAQFDRAKWRLMILAPAWTLQLFLALAMLGLFSWRLGDTVKHYDEREKHGDVPTVEFVWEATNVGMSVIIVSFTLFEIARFVSETLTPWTMLFTHVVKLACAAAILALDIVIYVQRSDKNYSLVGLGLDGVLIITAIALAIYVILTYRRLSSFDDYAHPANVKAFGFNDGLERDISYSSRHGLRPSLDKRISSASNRLSIGSAEQRVPLEGITRTPSYYSHQRDTQFDEFRARRESYGNTGGSMKTDVDRAMDVGFGWVSPPADGSPTREGTVTMGTVKTRSRGASMPRSPSWASDHVLVAVPEEDDDGDKKGMDREALLGDAPRDSIDVPPVAQEVDLAGPKR